MHLRRICISAVVGQRALKMPVRFSSVVPNLFGTRDQFRGRQFFHRPAEGGWFGDDSRALHLLCTLFPLLLHCNI